MMIQFEFDKSGNLKVPDGEKLTQLDRETAILSYTTGVLEDGTPYYAFVAVTPSRYQEFHELTKNRTPMIVGEFGTIIACGEGKAAPADVIQQMQDDYGFDPQYAPKLKAEVDKQQKDCLRTKEEKDIGNIVTMLKEKQKHDPYNSA